ncbi:FecR domain-containing protein [Amphritea sp.]|uniref:FecR family protein n=1 Tax=Amphritea sp. TaxID=1872502 RepID=UPI0025BD5D9C|nr:FecR domain-containing protein [Amphritea sp.]
MRSLLLTCILLLSSGLLSAAEVVGSVILSMGENIAIAADGSERVLKRQSEVYANDLLKTGEKGLLQLRFSDGSRLALKPSTEFRIAEYNFDEKQPEEGKAIFQLLKGGMRTISGQIGKSQKENYRLETTVATIGIRGTHYGVEYIDEGIYCETIEGAIEVTTKKKSVVVSAGEGAWLSNNGNIIKGDATGQTGDYVLQTRRQTGPGSTADKLDAISDDTGVIPAADPELEGIDIDSSQSATPQTQQVVAPDPTGIGSASPAGALTAVAFTENNLASGRRAGSGSVLVNSSSAINVDSSTGTGDLVTGISFIDSKPNTTANACSPCEFTGGNNVGFVTGVGNLTLGGAKLSWGRWNSGFGLTENGTAQALENTFHFMYTDSLTTQARLDVLETARSGSYLYTYSTGSTNLTAPEVDTGATGALVGYGVGATPAGRLYAGSYVMMNWDSLEIEQVSLIANVNDGAGIRNYQLTEQSGVTTTLNDVLQGGEMQLTGVCSGGNCSVGVNDTTMSGQMTFDLVGAQADGAITSYGATGSSPVNQDITLTGTVLLDSSGPAP